MTQNQHSTPLPLSAKRYQYRVGHGGFHATIVTEDGTDEPFAYIYDVGAAPSKPRLRSAIIKLKQELQHHSVSHVAYIVLSHIDEDHVNGIVELLTALRDAQITVGNVMLPWLTNVQKLLTKIRAPRRGIGPSQVVLNLAAADDEVVEYLTELGVQEVVFLLPDDDDTNDEEAGSGRQVANGENLATGWSSAWELRAFRIEPPSTALDVFATEVLRVTDLDPRKIQHHERLIRQYRTDIKSIMRSKPVTVHLPTPRGPSVTNWSSICLYGGATVPSGCGPHTAANGDLTTDCQAGRLHTADLPLNVKAVWDAFLLAWQRYLPQRRICVLFAPHHGSYLSHRAQLYSHFQPKTVCLTYGRSSSGLVAKLVPVWPTRRYVRRFGANLVELYNLLSLRPTRPRKK